jgi:predicted secreted protein
VAALRRVCADHGDNDWDTNLNLVNVVDKHLARYIDQEDEE